MFNSKLLWRMAVIILVVAFSIATIVSCGGDTPTQSTSLSTSSGGGTTGGGTPEPEPTPEPTPTFPDDPNSKYRITVLWYEGGAYEFDVDYRDTAKLNRIWLGQINREGAKDGKVFAIRNGRNRYGIEEFQKSLPAKDENVNLQDYYYFDSKGNIYYKPDNRLIKKFVGALIVPRIAVSKKNYGFADSVTHEYYVSKEYTVGGLYKMAISGDEAESIYGKGGSAKNAVHTFIEANLTLSLFWNGAYYKNVFFTRQFGRNYLEVLVMNPGANEGIKGAAGVDSYYAYYGGGFGHPDRTQENVRKMMDESLYLRERPEFVFPKFTRFVAFSDSGDTPWWSFMFMPGHPN